MIVPVENDAVPFVLVTYIFGIAVVTGATVIVPVPDPAKYMFEEASK